MIPVLIPAYKNREALASCVASVGAGAWIHIHHNWPETNLGYTKACNLLLLKADIFHSVPYAILINEDVQLCADAIDKARAFMDAHPRCAIAGFKQLDPANHDIITHGGTGAPYPAGVHLTGRVSAGDHAISRQMLWVNGAAMIVRLDAIREIGLMDERFFNWGSDSDWCMTAWQSGYEVWYCAEAVCLHAPGASSHPTGEQWLQMMKDMEAWGEKWREGIELYPWLKTPTHANNQQEATA